MCRDISDKFDKYVFNRHPSLINPKALLYLTVLVFSVFAGRWLMSFWTGTAKIHELYTAACGLYVCWLTIRAVTVLVAWMPQGRRVIFQKVKEWSLMVSLEKNFYWIINKLANGTCFIFCLQALLCHVYCILLFRPFWSFCSLHSNCIG